MLSCANDGWARTLLCMLTTGRVRTVGSRSRRSLMFATAMLLAAYMPGSSLGKNIPATTNVVLFFCFLVDRSGQETLAPPHPARGAARHRPSAWALLL